MHSTSASLLERLQEPGDQAAWERFAQLYTPVLFAWARRLGLNAEDAADLVQEVFTLLVQKLPEFRYHPGKKFRGWLYTVTVNKLREGKRRLNVPLVPADLANHAGRENGDFLAEAEYRQYLTNRAFQLMQADFQQATWRAFWEHVGVGRPARDVAAERGLRMGAVYAAKTRVLARLRAELRGLLD